MNRKYLKSQSFQASSSTLIILLITSAICLVTSVVSLSSGYFIIFQNLFYIPIIIACVFYTKRGFVYSLGLALLYFCMTWLYSQDTAILVQAIIRVLIFALVAAIITYLALARQRVEEILHKQQESLEDLIFERTAELEADYAQRKQTDNVLLLNALRMQSLLQLNQMTASSLQQITDYALEESVKLTQSKIGYLAFLNEDESILTMYSWSKSAMAECMIKDKPFVYPIVSTGLWGEAVRQRKPIITNDYHPGNPLVKGTPPGHVHLVRHMNVPIFSGAKIVIVAGVGNKVDDYDESDVQQLTLLMEALWHLLERKRATEEVEKYQDHLEEIVEERTKALIDANQKLLALDRLKSLFIASMSHELRTPLNSIIGFTGILLQGMAGPLNDEQLKQLGMVSKSSKHLLELINDVIDVSKIEAGKIDLAIGTFDLSKLLTEICSVFVVTAAERGIKLVLIDPGQTTLASDERRVRQIVMNLVSNAIKYSNHGTVKIALSKQASQVKITVSDDGMGIREQDMPRLFSQFGRIIVEGEELREGTGLGLYLSQKLAGVLGGAITAVSQFGQGSEFVLALPLHDGGVTL